MTDLSQNHLLDLSTKVQKINVKKEKRVSNNAFSNLEWCTPHQNIKHAVSNGLFNNPIILQFKNGKLVGVFHSTRDAAKATGLPYSAIGKCIQHSPEHKHVGGCVFRRATEIYGRPLNEEEE